MQFPTQFKTQQETRRDKLEVLSSGDERDWEYQTPAEVE